MKNKTKERSRTLAETVRMDEENVGTMAKFGSGGGGGGASSLGGVTGRDKNKEEYKPDRMATPKEMKSITSNQKIFKGSEGGTVGQSEQVKLGNQYSLTREKELMPELIKRIGSKRGEDISKTIKAHRWLRGK